MNAFKISTFLLLATITCASFSCSISGKSKTSPMKANLMPAIPDGEFLHYGDYIDGEKRADFYFVIRKIKESKGVFLYRVFFDIVPDKIKPLKNYPEWPAYTIFDPGLGSEIESEGKLGPGDYDEFKKFGMGGIIYWHLKLDRKEGIIEYVWKQVKDNITNKSRSRLKVNPDIPIQNSLADQFYLPRLLDMNRGGVINNVFPQFLKEPFTISMKIISKETVRTKAGIFRADRIVISIADLFLRRLVEQIPDKKPVTIWAEDSGRRLVLKVSTVSGIELLEEVSNVTGRQ
jgi:hypothetical protein